MDVTIWEMDGREEQMDTMRKMNERKKTAPAPYGHRGASMAEFMEAGDSPERTAALIEANSRASKAR